MNSEVVWKYTGYWVVWRCNYRMLLKLNVDVTCDDTRIGSISSSRFMSISNAPSIVSVQHIIFSEKYTLLLRNDHAIYVHVDYIQNANSPSSSNFGTQEFLKLRYLIAHLYKHYNTANKYTSHRDIATLYDFRCLVCCSYCSQITGVLVFM